MSIPTSPKLSGFATVSGEIVVLDENALPPDSVSVSDVSTDCSRHSTDTHDCWLDEDPFTKTGKHHKCKMLSWGTVQVRSFPTIPGDHPDTRQGPPLTIGWDHVEEESHDLEDYETQHQADNRRAQNKLILSSWQRRQILKRVGAAERDINAGIESAQKINRNRILTRYAKDEQEEDQE